MNILVICQYYYPEQFRINDICEELVKQGNNVTVLTGLPNYPTGIIPKEYKHFRKRRENINGVNVIRCWEVGRKKGAFCRMLNYFSYMFSASIKALFLKDDFDCVYVYQLSPVLMAIPGIVYKNKNKKSLHLYCLDLWPESLKTIGIRETSIIFKWIKKVSKKIYSNSDTISVTSNGFKKYFKEYLNVEKEIIYLPQYAESCFENIEYKNDNNAINLLFAGNVGEAQSVETIILAANELKDEKARIHIVGDGASLEKCKSMVKNMNIKNVVFYGKKPLKEMKKLYEMADAMLITLIKDENITKTVPGKLQSYMLSGRPILGAVDGETNDIIKKSKCGYCVNSEDYKGLAKIIKKFMDLDYNFKKKMGINSYEYYNKYYSKDKFFNKLNIILSKEK